MALHDFPQFIQENYDLHEWRHASSIFLKDFPSEYDDVMDVLANFRLLHKYIATPGGNKSPISAKLDGDFVSRGWSAKNFDTRILVDDTQIWSPTHEVDCFKNRIALEIEWNNKDPFFDRDLNNFRLLFDLRVVSVGIIITKSAELLTFMKKFNNERGRDTATGASTTHMGKLLPRIEGGGGGGCPILVFGIKPSLYVGISA